jgi:hypothetical protein
VSVTFEQDIQEGKRLGAAWSAFYRDVEIGGPAFGDPGGEFEPGMFLKEGVTITSRGCPARCPWCLVPCREGGIREYKVKPGYIVQDNNLLACSDGHLERVFRMLQDQKRGIIFSGGLDAVRIRWRHLDLFRSIRVAELWTACDSSLGLPILARAAEVLAEFPIRKKRCYVMVGFGDDGLSESERRIEAVYALGFLPFCQLYRGPGQRVYDREWKLFAKKWSRPAAYRGKKKEGT